MTGAAAAWSATTSEPTAVGAPLTPTTFAWGPADVVLYNLAVGAEELAYTWEEALRVIPTFGVLPPFASIAAIAAVGDLRLDPRRVLHGEQELRVHDAIPVAGIVTNRCRVVGVYDKGQGALVRVEVESFLEGASAPLFTNRFGIFVRGEGVSNGPKEERPTVSGEVPDRTPDAVVQSATSPTQAALYRLCGDRNPIHIDPTAAAAAGFDRPILHGLCTFGIVCKAAVDAVVGGATERVAGIRARFSGVVYPGETIVTQLWREEAGIVVRASTLERGLPVLTHAQLDLRAAA
jgi:acyl dehydratase